MKSSNKRIFFTRFVVILLVLGGIGMIREFSEEKKKKEKVTATEAEALNNTPVTVDQHRQYMQVSVTKPHEPGKFPDVPAPDRKIYSLLYETQLPEDPGLYDAPAQADCGNGLIVPLNPMEVRWMQPAQGINSETGLVMLIPGVTTVMDCDKVYVPADPQWLDERNLIVAITYQRNLGFAYPYDFAKYQVVDVLRATGSLLEKFPQIDKKRLYLYGISGGGLIGLETLQYTPGLWSEVHIHAALTKASLSSERDQGLYENDVEGGWNSHLTFPEEQGDLSDEQWQRYNAERDLRAPQLLARNGAIYAPIVGPMAPPVWIYHGDADQKVDFQHFLDYKSALEEFADRAANRVAEGRWRLGNWTLGQVSGGIHVYDVPQLIKDELPKAFLRRKEMEPEMTVDAMLPPQDGYTYHLVGDDLTTVELHVVKIE
jgi:Prolyl oligopeptidase family